MAGYSDLKTAIAQVIKTNGNQEITGQVLQNALTSIINTIGTYYTYAGLALPSTNPGAPDQRVFYLATTAGTYVNMGGIIIGSGETAYLLWNGASWSKQTTDLVNKTAINSKADKIQISNETATTKSIEANKLYVWGEVASLYISLLTPADSSVVNEFKFRFTSGNTPTRLSVPSNIKWLSELVIEANKRYEVSIIDNEGLIGGWNL